MCMACDDGRIEESQPISPSQEGYVVKLTGTLQGASTWNSRYKLALAGFAEEQEFAQVAKDLPTQDGPVSLTLNHIPQEVKKLELCVVNSLLKKVFTLQSFDLSSVGTDTLRLEVGDLQVSQFQVMQDHIFSTTCANCHGGSTFAAAGLYLTEGKSYECLVNHPSVKVPEALLVKPGDAEQSVLYRALATDLSTASGEGWRYDHSTEVVNSDVLNLIANWIQAGAAN